MSNESFRNYSSIQVSNETKTRLKSLSLTPRESYENIILRLLDAKLGNREIKYNIRSSEDKSINVDAIVDWGSESENIMFFDKKGIRKYRVPLYEGTDDEKQEGWDKFRDDINNLDNLVNIVAILEYDDEIRAGDLVSKRIS